MYAKCSSVVCWVCVECNSPLFSQQKKNKYIICILRFDDWLFSHTEFIISRSTFRLCLHWYSRVLDVYCDMLSLSKLPRVDYTALTSIAARHTEITPLCAMVTNTKRSWAQQQQQQQRRRQKFKTTEWNIVVVVNLDKRRVPHAKFIHRSSLWAAFQKWPHFMLRCTLFSLSPIRIFTKLELGVKLVLK